MKIKLFTVPVTNVADFNDELNSFLSNNKIVELEKQLIQTSTGAYWCFFINYIEHLSVRNMYDKSVKVDYKNVLSVEEFKTFDRLRVIRLQISQADNVSAFVVATDAELAEVAKLAKIDLASLQKVKGFGVEKIKKYGKRILEGLENMKKDDSVPNKKSGE